MGNQEDNTLKPVSFINRILIGLIDITFVIVPVHVLTYYIQYGFNRPPSSKEMMITEFSKQGLTKTDLESVSDFFPNLDQMFIYMDNITIYMPSLYDVAILFILFFIMWFLFNGKSLGLIIFGARIVNIDDEKNKLSFLTVFLRIWFTFISFIFSLGLLNLSFYDKFTKNYADVKSKTKVVYFEN